MFEKYTKGVLRYIKENENYPLLSTACPVDDKDRITLSRTQSFKNPIKKFHFYLITFFVLLRIYIMRGQIYDI